ncbi:MAG: type III secretion system cytoplasmic ring protein SctQ [Luteimonas sp.]
MPDSATRKSKPAPKTAARSAALKVHGLRGRVPGVPAAQADALRRFFAAPRQWLLDDGSVLQFAPGRASGADETFTVDAEGTQLRLRLDAPMPAQSVQPGLHWSDYQGRGRLLAWSLAHETALMRLSEAIGASLVPVEDNPASQDATGDEIFWLAFSIDHDAQDQEQLPASRVNGVMRIPVAWLSRLQARAAPVYEDDPLPMLGAWRNLPVPVLIGFDGPQLDYATWQGLQRGDVVVIGSGNPPAVRARTARYVWSLAPTPNGWRITSPTQTLSSPPEHSTMNDTNAPSDETGADPGNDETTARDLPVHLAFEIGAIELNVGELAALQPGYVFSLPAHLEGANVTIRANGRATGRGEVVAVGDTLGVRLLSWN